MRDLIEKNAHLFVSLSNPLGHTHLVQHEIPTGDAAPIRPPLRWMLPAHKGIVDKDIKKVLREDVIICY